jgi:type IX secretion system PorP/SprF family membrane protein
MNPSYTGSTDDIVIKGTYHKQWDKLDKSPNTQTLSAHFNLVDRLGVGAYFFRDEDGPLTLTGANISAAYHIPFGENDDRTKDQFSFGTSVSLMSQGYDWSKINAEDPSDELIGGKSVFLPYLNLGVSFIYRNFFGGVSVLDIPLGQNIPVVNSIEPSPTWYYANFGYHWALTDNLILTPSSVMSLNTNSESLLDLNFEAKFLFEDNSLSLGLSYRTGLDSKTKQNLFTTPFIRAEVGRLNFGVGYGFGMSDISKLAGNGIIFGLGYNLENVFNPNGFRY